MNDSLNPQRDTPLRRFNTFVWGMALFGIFGIASVIAYCWIGSPQDSVYEITSSKRLEIKRDIDAAQEELLTGKEIDEKTKQVAPEDLFEKLAPELHKGPKKTKVLVPGLPTEGSTSSAPVTSNLDGSKLFVAKACQTCHGAEGKAPIAPIYPVLAGKEASYLNQKMLDIKNEKYVTALTPQMLGMIKMCSDEEILAISQWLASVK